MWSKYELEEKQARFWRQATSGRIPLPEAERSGRYLSLEERLRIADLHVTGAGRLAREHGRGMPLMRRRSRPSFTDAVPRPANSTTRNWPPWCRPRCA